MPDRLTSQAILLSYAVISTGKMTHGFLPTCVQTNQLWPGDSRSYHICESETTFLGASLVAYPPGRWCRVREQGLACCRPAYWAFLTPLPLVSTTTEPHQRSCYPELRQDRWTPLGLQRLLPAEKHVLQLACWQPEPADQHPDPVSFPNTHWTELDSALELRSSGERRGEAPREWS